MSATPVMWLKVRTTYIIFSVYALFISSLNQILPSSVKLAIAIATEVALLSLFPTTNTNTRKSINKASYESNFQYATLFYFDSSKSNVKSKEDYLVL